MTRIKTKASEEKPANHANGTATGCLEQPGCWSMSVEETG